MKHGMKFRKLSRTSSHRAALLRNLVTSLLHHEQIQTTVPKAKEAARLAEKMISLGKKGSVQALRSAQGFLYPGHHFAAPSTPLVNPPAPSGFASSSTDASSSEEAPVNKSPTSLLPKLFSTLADRYSSRPGGYTRITKYGSRPGDNAPKCILSLVDGPRDLEWEMAARTLGKEVFERGRKGDVRSTVQGLVTSGLQKVGRAGKGVVSDDQDAVWGGLRENTQKSVIKVLRYRSEEEVQEFIRRSVAYAEALRIAPEAIRSLLPDDSEEVPKNRAYSINRPRERIVAGYRAPGSSVALAGLGLAQGILGRQRRGKHQGLGEIPEGDSMPERQSLSL